MSDNKSPKKKEVINLPLKQVEEELVAINPKIFDGLNQNKKAEVIATFSSVVKIHSGPLPSPDTLREYEDILPGSAKTIFEVFRNQTEHRMGLENLVVTSQQKQSSLGQNYAFIIALVFLIASVVCVLLGHEVSGTIIGSIDLVSLVTVFIVGKQFQKQNLNEKKPKK